MGNKQLGYCEAFSYPNYYKISPEDCESIYKSRFKVYDINFNNVI